MVAVIFEAAPRISEVVQDTKILLRQSREKLVITYVAHHLSHTSRICTDGYLFPNLILCYFHTPSSRVANDIASYDKSQYRVSIVPSATTARLAYHLGEKITVKWQAPHGHSRKDWIGLYRVRLVLPRVAGEMSNFM